MKIRFILVAFAIAMRVIYNTDFITDDNRQLHFDVLMEAIREIKRRFFFRV